jgi:hypothetical protein
MQVLEDISNPPTPKENKIQRKWVADISKNVI